MVIFINYLEPAICKKAYSLLFPCWNEISCHWKWHHKQMSQHNTTNPHTTLFLFSKSILILLVVYIYIYIFFSSTCPLLLSISIHASSLAFPGTTPSIWTIPSLYKSLSFFFQGQGSWEGKGKGQFWANWSDSHFITCKDKRSLFFVCFFIKWLLVDRQTALFFYIFYF